MLWHHNARVNSHQRWNQTRFRVCFHLWCELTSTMNVTEWQVTWNSWCDYQTLEFDLITYKEIESEKFNSIFNLFSRWSRTRGILPSFLRDGQKPSGLQHGSQCVWRHNERNVWNPRLHWIHHWQGGPKYCQTGKLYSSLWLMNFNVLGTL